MLAYQTREISSLADQLRRGPSRLRLRQLLGIEFLCSLIEPGRSYPFDFVCHAITGYRPRESDTESRLLSANALRSDLVALSEALSQDAGLAAAVWPEPVFTVAELAKRFDVSTKTIFRWHRRGLIGWRFRFPDSRIRLAFPDRAVRRFVAQNAGLVQRGSNFTQLSADEKQRIVARAEDLVAAGQRTVNAVARRIAGETGRAVETIRLILKAHDESRPQAGIFNRSPLRVPADDRRLAIWEAYVDGASLEALAARFEQPVAAIYRAITQMRAADLKSRRIEFVDAPEFHGELAADIARDPNLASPYAATAGPLRIPTDLPPYLQQLFRSPLLTPAGERALFRHMNHLKSQAETLRAALDPEQATAMQIDRIEDLLSAAAAVKNQITQANLRLVVSIAKRHLSPAHDLFELISDGNVSLMRAIDKFDFTRGFKFSTYASWAIMKNFARSVPEQRTQRDRYQTGREELLDNLADAAFDVESSEADAGPVIRNALDHMLSTLEEREQHILRLRYGLEDGQREPQTLEQIGMRMGVSKERVRQLEARALAKLRAGFTPFVGQLVDH